MKLRLSACIVFGLLLGTSLARAKEISIQNLPPVVVKTVPESGSLNVDPNTSEIRGTFSKDMRVGGWSCVNLSKDTFPPSAGDPRYEQDKRTFVLPVKLEPGRVYAILINSEKYGNFKDTQGKSAMPYLLVFETARQ